MFRGLSAREILVREADKGAGAGGTPANQGEPGASNGNVEETTVLTWDTWYGGLDAAQKGLLDGHVTGLKTALQSERTERGNLAKQINDLKTKAEKGSDLEKQLGEMSGKLEATERRAAFVEEAVKPENGCVNVKAAYALAVSEGLFNSRGQPDWTALKQNAPELFRKAGSGSADGGAGNNQSPRLDMNSIIRRAAGRG